VLLEDELDDVDDVYDVDLYEVEVEPDSGAVCTVDVSDSREVVVSL
jgi:hypothetical protein